VPTTPTQQPTDFMFITAKSQDSLASLALKYLKDERKAWRIAEFNGIKQITPGQLVQDSGNTETITGATIKDCPYKKNDIVGAIPCGCP